MRILVVEDDADLRRLWSLLLARQGHVPVSAANGAEALHRLQSGRIDLILLDLEMPVLDGTSFAAALRQNPVWADLPIVVASARPDTPAIARELGARAWLVKPFGAEQLVDAIRRAVLPR